MWLGYQKFPSDFNHSLYYCGTDLHSWLSTPIHDYTIAHRQSNRFLRQGRVHEYIFGAMNLHHVHIYRMYMRTHGYSIVYVVLLDNISKTRCCKSMQMCTVNIDIFIYIYAICSIFIRAKITILLARFRKIIAFSHRWWDPSPNTGDEPRRRPRGDFGNPKKDIYNPGQIRDGKRNGRSFCGVL